MLKNIALLDFTPTLLSKVILFYYFLFYLKNINFNDLTLTDSSLSSLATPKKLKKKTKKKTGEVLSFYERIKNLKNLLYKIEKLKNQN